MLVIVLGAGISFVIVNILDNSIYSVTPELEPILFSLLTIWEYSFFSYFLFLSVEDAILKRIIVLTSIAFIIFCIIHRITSTYTPIDSLPIGIETIIILSFSFGFLYEKMNDPKTLFVYNDYRFWIVLAFMIYLAGSFFIYIFANQIPRSDLPRYWIFTYIFYVIKNILFSIAILIFCFQKTEKTPRRTIF